MKTNFTLFFLSILFICFGCQEDKKGSNQGTTIGALYLSEARPAPGDNLQIAYSPEEAIKEKMEAYYYYMVGTEMYAKDLKLKDSSGIWKGNLAIPDSATAIAINFEIDGTLDTNSKKGYVFPLYGDGEEAVPGGLAGKGFFYFRMGNRIGLEMKNDSILALVEKDLEAHPDIKPSWDEVYARVLYRTDPKKAKNYIQDQIASYSEKEKLSEEDYAELNTFYRLLQNNSKVDSLQAVVIEKYPRGMVAKSIYFGDFRQTANLAKQEDMLKNFDNKFDGGKPYKNMMARIVANKNLQQGNFDKFMEYSQQLPGKQKASLYNNTAWNWVEKGKNLDQAEKLSKKSLELVKTAMEDPEGKPQFRTERQYIDGLQANYRMYADTYALILFKQGNVEEALAYQEKAIGKELGSEVNERYVQFLMAAGKTEEAQEKAAEYIKNNVATQKTKSYFTEAYVKNTGSEDGLKEKMTELEKIGHEKALAVIKEEMLNEPAPDFTLTDLEGNKIALADLKGKTVILDFWATWCGPCKASFPGMQIAVEKYKDNPDVAFFFVNTMETANTPEARTEKVGGFIEQNSYDFHVLLDQAKSESSRIFKTADNYGIRGIPTKIIIGPEGNINFKKVGYGGNNEKMLQEIEMMIELAES